MPARSASDVSILIVDDATGFREAARELLERRGYVVAGEANCAASARNALDQLTPDGVLLDVNLPDANGFELAAELMRNDPALAILLVSAGPLCETALPHSPARGFVLKSELAKTDLATFWPCPQRPP